MTNDDIDRRDPSGSCVTRVTLDVLAQAVRGTVIVSPTLEKERSCTGCAVNLRDLAAGDVLIMSGIGAPHRLRQDLFSAARRGAAAVIVPVGGLCSLTSSPVPLITVTDMGHALRSVRTLFAPPPLIAGASAQANIVSFEKYRARRRLPVSPLFQVMAVLTPGFTGRRIAFLQSTAGPFDHPAPLTQPLRSANMEWVYTGIMTHKTARAVCHAGEGDMADIPMDAIMPGDVVRFGSVIEASRPLASAAARGNHAV